MTSKLIWIDSSLRTLNSSFQNSALNSICHWFWADDFKRLSLLFCDWKNYMMVISSQLFHMVYKILNKMLLSLGTEHIIIPLQVYFQHLSLPLRKRSSPCPAHTSFPASNNFPMLHDRSPLDEYLSPPFSNLSLFSWASTLQTVPSSSHTYLTPPLRSMLPVSLRLLHPVLTHIWCQLWRTSYLFLHHGPRLNTLCSMYHCSGECSSSSSFVLMEPEWAVSHEQKRC